MKLLVFGPTGGTGRQLVEQALAQGHVVTAFARNPAKLDIEHENLHVVQGDVLDSAAVEAAIQGQEVVLCALGAPASDKSTVRANGTKTIIDAMEKVGVRRFICQASLGYGDSRELLPFHMKYIIVPLILRHTFADHESQEAYIKQSQLDWIIVRPANLTDGPRIGTYQHGTLKIDKKIKLKVSRADVADFMLKQLADDTYLHKTPGLSY
jgi:putative NADH-flavin reductase